MYKNKLDRPQTNASVDERQQLNSWYLQVVAGSDVRDQVTVTGFNISRGVFGSISLDTNSQDDDPCAGALVDHTQLGC